MATPKQFLREYVKAIRDGNAAVFAGAGLSRPSGFVDWKELLRPLADDIDLNIDEEHDLAAVAQYVRNKAGNRATINSSLLDAFSKDVSPNENVSILTRLPIHTYWTTNYDHLIETGLQEANRNSDVKIEYKQLSTTKRDRDAIVYKMHGDADRMSIVQVVLQGTYTSIQISELPLSAVLYSSNYSPPYVYVIFNHHG